MRKSVPLPAPVPRHLQALEGSQPLTHWVSGRDAEPLGDLVPDDDVAGVLPDDGSDQLDVGAFDGGIDRVLNRAGAEFDAAACQSGNRRAATSEQHQLRLDALGLHQPGVDRKVKGDVKKPLRRHPHAHFVGGGHRGPATTTTRRQQPEHLKTYLLSSRARHLHRDFGRAREPSQGISRLSKIRTTACSSRASR